MIIDSCDWNAPGHDPYTKDFSAWVAQVPIPAPAKLELIAKVAAKDYSDVVYISRDGIESANPQVREFKYGPELTYMAFGGKGRMCKNISRAKWSLQELQSAMVFCTARICVARPSICNNWSLIVREEQPPEQPPTTPIVPVSPPVAEVTIPPPETFTPPVAELPPVGPCVCCEGFLGGGGGTFGGVGGGGGGGGYIPRPPQIATPIPEPETYALMIVGLIFVGIRRLRNRLR